MYNVLRLVCTMARGIHSFVALREKYDSKKPAMQSQLAEFSNCLHMPVETVEQYINRLSDISACMANDDEDSSNQGYILHIRCVCPD